MVFDDSFFQLTGGKDIDGNNTGKKTDKKDKDSNLFGDWLSLDDDDTETGESASSDSSVEASSSNMNPFASPDDNVSLDFSSTEEDTPKESSSSLVIPELTPPGEKWSSEYGNPDQDYVIESDLVVPTIKPIKKEESKPCILVIDDDFDTLDLLKIYFARGYEYVSFSGPREAIFYLNEHIPDLILLDCYIHTIKAARVVDIIHSYKEIQEVPIYYLCEEYERGAIETKLPDGVAGIIERPVSRKSIQEMLDTVFPKDKTQ